MTALTILDRVIYTEAEAARILGMPASTLHYWLEGKQYRGKTYQPVIRIEPQGTKELTWAEFVEAGLLRAYRRAEVPMIELRAFIDSLRDKFGVPYPLAHERPLTSGGHLVMEAQGEANLPQEYWLFAGDQLLLPAAEDFLHRLSWDAHVAAGWRPAADTQSTVRCIPTRRFGRPQVSGVSTEVIWEHHLAEEDEDDIADQFGLGLRDVQWALAYELSAHASKAA